MLKNRPDFPSARQRTGLEWNCRCRQWKRVACTGDVLLRPALEYDELPQPEVVVPLARQMFMYDSLDESWIEVPALEAFAREERIGKQFAQTAAEPDTQWDAEPLLPPTQDFGRQQRRCQLFEGVLPPTLFNLVFRWQPKRELDHLVVEQRHA